MAVPATPQRATRLPIGGTYRPPQRMQRAAPIGGPEAISRALQQRAPADISQLPVQAGAIAAKPLPQGPPPELLAQMQQQYGRAQNQQPVAYGGGVPKPPNLASAITARATAPALPPEVLQNMLGQFQGAKAAPAPGGFNRGSMRSAVQRRLGGLPQRPLGL